jgi:hypothetical protein
MRVVLLGALLLLSGPTFAEKPGIPAAPFVKLITASGHQCAESALVMQEMSGAETAFSVFCPRAPQCSGADVFRVVRGGGKRSSVQRYIDPFSGKAVLATCPY